MKAAFEHRFPPEFAQMRMLRKALRDQLVKWKVAPSQLDRTLLVVDELVSNAIEHGLVHRKAHEPLALHARIDGRDLVLGLEDPEVPSEVVTELERSLGGSKAELPALDSERGRGLFLIATWLEQITVRRRSGGGMSIEGRIPGAHA